MRQVVAMKLQSDAELADSIVRNKWRTAKWARPRIAVALRQRGIERAEAQVALDALFVRGEGIGVVGLYRDEAEEGDDVGGGGAWGDEGGIDTPLEKDLYKAALRQWRRASCPPACIACVCACWAPLHQIIMRCVCRSDV